MQVDSKLGNHATCIFSQTGLKFTFDSAHLILFLDIRLCSIFMKTFHSKRAAIRPHICDHLRNTGQTG